MARRASWGSRAPGPELGLGQAGREPQGRRLRYNCAFPFPGGNRCASLPAATNGLHSRSSPLIKGDSLLSELLLRFFSLCSHPKTVASKCMNAPLTLNFVSLAQAHVCSCHLSHWRLTVMSISISIHTGAPSEHISRVRKQLFLTSPLSSSGPTSPGPSSGMPLLYPRPQWVPHHRFSQG